MQSVLKKEKILLNQIKSNYWGIWGVEQYKFKEKDCLIKHNEEANKLNQLLNKANPRLKIALNFSYGICNLQGISKPIEKHEFNLLMTIYNNALEFSRNYPEEISLLIQELFLIKSTCDLIPNFQKGNLVNETDNDEILRKYVYLDFFKFSLINILMRLDESSIQNMAPAEFACCLILSFFVGNGQFIEKTFLFFEEHNAEILKKECIDICNKIEISPEYPLLDVQVYLSQFSNILNFIKQNRINYTTSELENKKYKYYSRMTNLYNEKHSLYLNLKPQKILIKDPFKEIKKIWEKVNFQNLKVDENLLPILKNLKNNTNYHNHTYPIPTVDFYSTTNSEGFLFRQYEYNLLANIFSSNIKDTIISKCIFYVYNDIGPFLSYKLSGKLFDDNPVFDKDLPKLNVAHHIHNSNCEKVFSMMAINRCVKWPKKKLRLLISSSSSKIDIVKQERQNCIDLGFTHYRIHERRHLKAGNQNRGIPNSIDHKGYEFYLTLDDDYFTFPEFPFESNEFIQKNNLEFYQAPLCFKGVYKPNLSQGEKVDSESLFYFEKSFGSNRPRIFVFPRGSGTIFTFKEGVSSITQTGGFFIESVAEDFGHGFLSLFIKNKKFSPGLITDITWCIGEGVDLTGKFAQSVRWAQGYTEIFKKILFPYFFKSIINLSIFKLPKFQILRLLTLGLNNILGIFLVLFTFLYPFLKLIFDYFNYSPKIIGYSNDQLFQFDLAAIILILHGILFFLFNINQFFLIYKKISLSPFRMFTLFYLITVTTARGYFYGLIKRKKSVWSANKSRKIRIQEYVNHFILIILNVIAFLVNIFLYHKITFLPLFNSCILFFGILLLLKKYSFSRFKIEIPVYILKIISTIILTAIGCSLIFNIYSIVFFNYYTISPFFTYATLLYSIIALSFAAVYNYK